MKETKVAFIKRTFGVGPHIMSIFVAMEVAAFFLHRISPLPLNLSMKLQIILTVPLVLIFVTGYLSFLITYAKHSVGIKVNKSGPYRLVRHPLYATDIFALPAIVAVWFNDFFFIGSWLVLYIILYFLAKKEEKFMEERFGDEYRDYKRKVPALIPYKGFIQL